MTFSSHRDQSRTNWGCDGQPTIEQIQLGAVLRIADAVEAMAENHVRLMADRDMFERCYRDEQLRRERAERSAASLRGHIKRLKRMGAK